MEILKIVKNKRETNRAIKLAKDEIDTSKYFLYAKTVRRIIEDKDEYFLEIYKVDENLNAELFKRYYSLIDSCLDNIKIDYKLAEKLLLKHRDIELTASVIEYGFLKIPIKFKEHSETVSIIINDKIYNLEFTIKEQIISDEIGFPTPYILDALKNDKAKESANYKNILNAIGYINERCHDTIAFYNQLIKDTKEDLDEYTRLSNNINKTLSDEEKLVLEIDK